MRRNPSTVVVLAGQAPEEVLGAVSRSMNVSLVRPEDAADGIEAAAGALRRAAGSGMSDPLGRRERAAEAGATDRSV